MFPFSTWAPILEVYREVGWISGPLLCSLAGHTLWTLQQAINCYAHVPWL